MYEDENYYMYECQIQNTRNFRNENPIARICIREKQIASFELKQEALFVGIYINKYSTIIILSLVQI